MTIIVRSAEVADLEAILAIYNDAVVNTTAIWNDALADIENRLAWYESRLRQGYPVLVAEIEGAVAGYGSFGDFRAFDGYRHTVEHSVYVGADFRRQGAASALLTALVERATGMGKHVMIAGIAGDNQASLALHARHGFIETARMPEVGRKFGRWLDLVFMQKMLSRPPALTVGPPGQM